MVRGIPVPDHKFGTLSVSSGPMVRVRFPFSNYFGLSKYCLDGSTTVSGCQYFSANDYGFLRKHLALASC